VSSTRASKIVKYVSEPSAVDHQHHSSSLLKVAGREFDLTEYFRIFWRRKSLFAGIVALLMALSAAGVRRDAALHRKDRPDHRKPRAESG
jgi:hypothetical protein